MIEATGYVLTRTDVPDREGDVFVWEGVTASCDHRMDRVVTWNWDPAPAGRLGMVTAVEKRAEGVFVQIQLLTGCEDRFIDGLALAGMWGDVARDGRTITRVRLVSVAICWAADAITPGTALTVHRG